MSAGRLGRLGSRVRSAVGRFLGEAESVAVTIEPVESLPAAASIGANQQALDLPRSISHAAASSTPATTSLSVNKLDTSEPPDTTPLKNATREAHTREFSTTASEPVRREETRVLYDEMGTQTPTAPLRESFIETASPKSPVQLHNTATTVVSLREMLNTTVNDTSALISTTLKAAQLCVSLLKSSKQDLSSVTADALAASLTAALRLSALCVGDHRSTLPAAIASQTTSVSDADAAALASITASLPHLVSAARKRIDAAFAGSSGAVGFAESISQWPLSRLINIFSAAAQLLLQQQAPVSSSASTASSSIEHDYNESVAEAQLSESVTSSRSDVMTLHLHKLVQRSLFAIAKILTSVGGSTHASQSLHASDAASLLMWLQQLATKASSVSLHNQPQLRPLLLACCDSLKRQLFTSSVVIKQGSEAAVSSAISSGEKLAHAFNFSDVTSLSSLARCSAQLVVASRDPAVSHALLTSVAAPALRRWRREVEGEEDGIDCDTQSASSVAISATALADAAYAASVILSFPKGAAGQASAAPSASATATSGNTAAQTPSSAGHSSSPSPEQLQRAARGVAKRWFGWVLNPDCTKCSITADGDSTASTSVPVLLSRLQAQLRGTHWHPHLLLQLVSNLAGPGTSAAATPSGGTASATAAASLPSALLLTCAASEATFRLTEYHASGAYLRGWYGGAVDAERDDDVRRVFAFAAPASSGASDAAIARDGRISSSSGLSRGALAEMMAAGRAVDGYGRLSASLNLPALEAVVRGWGPSSITSSAADAAVFAEQSSVAHRNAASDAAEAAIDVAEVEEEVSHVPEMAHHNRRSFDGRDTSPLAALLTVDSLLGTAVPSSLPAPSPVSTPFIGPFTPSLLETGAASVSPTSPLSSSSFSLMGALDQPVGVTSSAAVATAAGAGLLSHCRFGPSALVTLASALAPLAHHTHHHNPTPTPAAAAPSATVIANAAVQQKNQSLLLHEVRRSLSAASSELCSALGTAGIAYSVTGESRLHDEVGLLAAFAFAGVPSRGMFSALAKRIAAKGSLRRLGSLSDGQLVTSLSALCVGWSFEERDGLAVLIREIQARAEAAAAEAEASGAAKSASGAAGGSGVGNTLSNNSSASSGGGGGLLSSLSATLSTKHLTLAVPPDDHASRELSRYAPLWGKTQSNSVGSNSDRGGSEGGLVSGKASSTHNSGAKKSLPAPMRDNKTSLSAAIKAAPLAPAIAEPPSPYLLSLSPAEASTLRLAYTTLAVASPVPQFATELPLPLLAATAPPKLPPNYKALFAQAETEADEIVAAEAAAISGPREANATTASSSSSARSFSASHNSRANNNSSSKFGYSSAGSSSGSESDSSVGSDSDGGVARSSSRRIANKKAKQRQRLSSGDDGGNSSNGRKGTHPSTNAEVDELSTASSALEQVASLLLASDASLAPLFTKQPSLHSIDSNAYMASVSSSAHVISLVALLRSQLSDAAAEAAARVAAAADGGSAIDNTSGSGARSAADAGASSQLGIASENGNGEVDDDADDGFSDDDHASTASGNGRSGFGDWLSDRLQLDRYLGKGRQARQKLKAQLARQQAQMQHQERQLQQHAAAERQPLGSSIGSGAATATVGGVTPQSASVQSPAAPSSALLFSHRAGPLDLTLGLASGISPASFTSLPPSLEAVLPTLHSALAERGRVVQTGRAQLAAAEAAAAEHSLDSNGSSASSPSSSVSYRASRERERALVEGEKKLVSAWHRLRLPAPAAAAGRGAAAVPSIILPLCLPAHKIAFELRPPSQELVPPPHLMEAMLLERSPQQQQQQQQQPSSYPGLGSSSVSGSVAPPPTLPSLVCMWRHAMLTQAGWTVVPLRVIQLQQALRKPDGEGLHGLLRQLLPPELLATRR